MSFAERRRSVPHFPHTDTKSTRGEGGGGEHHDRWDLDGKWLFNHIANKHLSCLWCGSVCFPQKFFLSGAAVPLLPLGGGCSFFFFSCPSPSPFPRSCEDHPSYCVSSRLPRHQMLRSISIPTHPAPHKSNIFPMLTLKSAVLGRAEPVFEQGQCEDSSQDSQRSLFSFGPGEVYFPPLIIPALFSQQPSYLHSHS